MADQRLRSLEDPETLRRLVRKLREGIYITSASGEILDANQACLDILGVEAIEDLRGVKAQDLFIDPGRREEELALLQDTGAVREFEFEIRRPDGKLRTVLDTCYLVRAGGEILFHGILIDISERKKLESQLLELSLRDPLTGCYNRRYLERITPELEAGDEPFGVLIVDIDHFKDYNDRYGHTAGDRVLVQVSRFLTSGLRADDAVIRLGGDEFLVLFRGEKAATLADIAGRLKAKARRTAPVPFSLGWAVRDGGEGLEATVERADQNLLHVRIERRRFAARRKLAGS